MGKNKVARKRCAGFILLIMAMCVFSMAISVSATDTKSTDLAIVDSSKPQKEESLKLFTQSTVERWVKLLGTSSNDYGKGIAVDSSGNVYVTGSTWGDLDGNTNAGGGDIFVAKYDANGNKQWTKLLGSSKDDDGRGIAVDSSGNVYVTGVTSGDLEGNTNHGENDIFVAKCDSSGTWQWTRVLGTSSRDDARGIAVDSSGSVYVTGETYGDLSGNTNVGGGDIFVAKYDSSGNHQWTKLLGSSSWDWGNGIAVDSSGNVYITGYTEGDLDGNTNTEGADVFVAKYDANGKKQWMELLDSSSWDEGHGIAVDSNGNVYVTGRSDGNLGGNTNAGSSDIFVAKYDSSGKKQWTKLLGSSSLDWGYGIAVDSSGNVYVTGRSEGNLGGNTNAGEKDIFVWKLIDTPTPTPTLPLLCTDPDSLTHEFGTVPEGQSIKWTFDITNCGEGTLTWTVSADRSWITVSPPGDSITKETDTVTVSIDTTGLECGKKHTGTITVKSDGGTKQGGITVYVPELGEGYIFITKWGSWGTGDGKFEPAGIAVDRKGNVFVADIYNSRIQKFDSNGNFITTWGEEGTGDGELYYPAGIAVDSSGNVYVADIHNNRIQKFDSDGNFITKWGSYGNESGEFFSPEGIAADSSGNVFVTDSGNDRIQKFDSSGNFITKWGEEGTGDGEFDWPWGIAVDSSGNVYVADTPNNQIQKFDSDGNFIATWGCKGTGEGEFDWPKGIAVDSSGNVYVADYINDRIQKFDSAGNFIIKWGSYGIGDGQFDGLQGVAVDSSGNVFVADTHNNRIQKFGPGSPEEPVSCTDPDPPSHDFGSVPKGQTRDWTFDITNCGGGTLTWSVSADQSWITVTPPGDSTTTETDAVTVSIDTTGLECGKKHTGTITVKSDGGTKHGGITVNVPAPGVTRKAVELKEPIQEDLFSGEALKVWIENPAVTAIQVHFDELNTAPEWGALQILNEQGSVIWEVSGYLGDDVTSTPIYGRTFIIKIIKASESDKVSYAIDKLFYWSEDPDIIVSKDSLRHEIIDSPPLPSPEKVNIHGIQEGRISLTRPTNNDVFSYGHDIAFRWKADNEGLQIQSYDFYIGTKHDMANQVTYLLGGHYEMSTYEIERILGTERALHWCVVGRYYDPSSEESLQVRSPVWSFTVDPPDEPTVTLIAPQNNSRGVMATPTFHWKVDPFEFYSYRSQVFLGKTPDILEPLTTYPVDGFYYSLNESKQPLELDTTYFWQVKLFDHVKTEPIAVSKVMSFRTDEEPWTEVILEEPIRRDIPPGRALRVCIPGAQEIIAHFSELDTTPDWSSIQIVNDFGAVLWEVSGDRMGEITSDPVGGEDIILRIHKSSEADNVSYTIDKLFYRGLKEAITADDVSITNISDPVMEYFDTSAGSLSWSELESKLECIKEKRIVLYRPGNNSEEPYGKNIRFTWMADTAGLPFDTCSYDLFIGNSTNVYQRVVQNPSYQISAQEIERILGEDKERQLYWCVKGTFFVQGQDEKIAFRSPMQSFKIKPIVKPALTLTSPPNNARGVWTKPTLHWSVTSVDTSKPLYLSYRSQVFMGKSPDILEPLTTYPVDGFDYSLNESEQPLELDTTYFWQVKLFDHVKTEPIVESQVMQFATSGSDEAGDGTGFDDAIALSDGQPQTGNVVKGGKVYYKFHLSAGQQATVTMQPLDADQDLYIYNPSRVQIDVSGNSEKNTEVCFPIADAEGYYYAMVDGFAAGSFTITLKVSGGASEAGEGTGFDDAIELSDGQSLTGNVVKGDSVYYKFHLSAGQQATVTMQPQDDDQDLYIFNPSREQIDVSGNSETNTEECTFTADVSGYYYAKVDGFEAGSYTITLKVSGGASEAGEGTGFDDAIALSDGQTLTGNVVKGDSVYYKFHLSAGQEATVTMQPQDDDQDLYIFNPSREQIDVSGNSEKNTEECFPIADAEGYYYAKVDGYEAGSFTITLSISGIDDAGFDDADVLPPGGGTIVNVLERLEDFYKFYLSRGQTVTVTLEPLDTDRDLYVYDTSRNQIGVSRNSGTAIDECTFTADADGYYYIKVQSNEEAGFYSLTISVSG